MRNKREHASAIIARIQRAAAELGIDCPEGFEWEFEEGSKTYGRAFGLFWRDAKTGALYRPAGISATLGRTYEEAFHSLYLIADVLESVIWTRREREDAK